MKASLKTHDEPTTPVAITQMQLAELACRLVPHDDEAPSQLVRRALSIWEAAGELLADNRGEAKTKSPTSFDEVGSKGLLPAIREKTQVVGTGKGVEQAVKRFFDEVLAGYDRAMNGRIMGETVLRENKQAIKKMCAEVLTQRKLPAHLLEQLRQFQNQCRDDSFSVTVETIRGLLNGADVGLLSPEI